jgi:hypothetical protein
MKPRKSRREPEAEPPIPAAPRDVAAERLALEIQRRDIGMRIGMPTAEAAARRHALIAAIDAQLAALPFIETRETGQSAGSVIFADSRMGSPFALPLDSDEPDHSQHVHHYEIFDRE